MKFALILRGQYRQDEDLEAGHHGDLALVRRADALGFDAIARAQHYSAYPWQMLQQIPFLAQVAAIAPRMRLITGVTLLPLVKPLDMAEQLATLDVMSGGKLIFGAGIGYREVEFQAFGTTLKEAGPRFEENLTAIRRLWTEDEVTLTGSHFTLQGARCSVKPIQRPSPPVWIGANADRGIRRAARMADSWFVNPHNTLETLDRQMALYRRELDARGKPFPAELPMAREVFLAPSREEALRIVRPALEAKYRSYREWGQDKAMPAEDHFDRDFESLANDRFLLGTPAEVTEQLLALNRRFGVNYFVVCTHLPGTPHTQAMEQLEMFATEVMPALASA
ncbi:MAG: LLM class flavin-dependent oxidoreductase [Rhodospirillales bacterium]|nr:LLM class flavin-dependent oxidoreductase [Rhodospirillales bacterium]